MYGRSGQEKDVKMNFAILLRYTKCEGLNSLSTKSDMCTVCKTVNKTGARTCHHRPEINKTHKYAKKRKQESLMRREELLEMLQEKRLKCNVLHWENYLREKVNLEMKEFDDEDNNNFVTLFKGISKERM